MKMLLDTHVFIWLDSAPEKLSSTALAVCQEQRNTLYLSMASIWEMQIKQQLGKLAFKLPLQQLVEWQCLHNGLQILLITTGHIYALNDLPSHHKDPFDRVILVQAKLENLTLISADSIFNRYGVDLFW
ncbi:type II toxin-antitoxin system VapC family toxin [Methylomicrobium sp. Wu6]|uniref:type II toxin-antitoxin system VapC family toxin n=1 Tax=Methylomicrobium sp. Wu6 TaxID=3107928 RepID=UPI002DD64B7B|nr:type II toxin-antitoxin system VapC family toxin [Methylomicrobium sp. Wu6]MEC4748053.1 type II toxin-antitoxin system VapC family toxin [Methylomicrobium sp. Wu6]